MHNIYGDHSGYATFCTADRCGVAVFLESRLGMDDLVVDGITVAHEQMVRGGDGRMLWPILVEGIARISVPNAATSGEKVWVDYTDGRTDGKWFDGAIQCTNITFLTGGNNPLVIIEKKPFRVPPPQIYVPMKYSLEVYHMAEGFVGVPDPNVYLPLLSDLTTYYNGTQVYPVVPAPPNLEDEGGESVINPPTEGQGSQDIVEVEEE